MKTNGLLLKNLLYQVRSKLNEDKSEAELKRILKKDYVSFVNDLGDFIKDPKFVDAIKSLSSNIPVKTSNIDVACKDLKPSQNEVVLANSLSYPMKDPSGVDAALSGGPVSPGGRLVVTGGDGKFIIDGHHRWSQVYCINPEAKIKCKDLPDIKNPMKALKATQLGIGAELGTIPKAEGGGVNLFEIGENQLKKYVIENIQDSVIEVFKKHDKGNNAESVADYIWDNVKKLQVDNTPVDDAPVRNVMPQTDDAPQWVDNTFNVEKIPEIVIDRLKQLVKYNNK
jgi:hypothetical protein